MFFVVVVVLCLFAISSATLTARGGSQARGPIGAIATATRNPKTSWFLVRFVNYWATMGTPRLQCCLFVCLFVCLKKKALERTVLGLHQWSWTGGTVPSTSFMAVSDENDYLSQTTRTHIHLFSPPRKTTILLWFRVTWSQELSDAPQLSKAFSLYGVTNYFFPWPFLM